MGVTPILLNRVFIVGLKDRNFFFPIEHEQKIPSEDALNKVVVDASVVKGESEPLLVYEKAPKTKTG